MAARREAKKSERAQGKSMVAEDGSVLEWFSWFRRSGAWNRRNAPHSQAHSQYQSIYRRITRAFAGITHSLSPSLLTVVATVVIGMP